MPLEPYHTGIVVEDVATAIPIWEAATGVPWGSVYAGPLVVRTPASGEIVTHQIEMAYSRDMRLELVKAHTGHVLERERGNRRAPHRLLVR